jgi:hypothetical protein
MSTNSTPSDAGLPSSWNEEDEDAIRSDAKSKKWWIIGALVVLLLVVIAGLVIVKASDPKDRAWPESVGGRPQGLGGEKETAADVTPTAAPGVYIWNSFDGWHLWLVNGDGIDGLKGTIKSNTDFVGATSSAPDAGTATLDGKTITFDLKGASPLAGVDFDPGFGKKLTFTLETAGGEVQAAQVFTGSQSTPVEAVPVIIDKPVVD